MDRTKKLARLQRLLDQARDVRTQDSDDPTFKAWKNTVERTLIHMFGTDSPEVEQFKQLRFFYSPVMWMSGDDFSSEHREVFQRDFHVALASIKNYMQELEEFPDDEDVPEKTAPGVRKIFISHASGDVHYVEELIECLEAIGLPTESIFCTSFEGLELI